MTVKEAAGARRRCPMLASFAPPSRELTRLTCTSACTSPIDCTQAPVLYRGLYPEGREFNVRNRHHVSIEYLADIPRRCPRTERSSRTLNKEDPRWLTSSPPRPFALP